MLVVTLPSDASDAPARFAARAAAAGADVVEVRGDLTPDVRPFETALPLLVAPRGTGARLVEALRPRWVDLARGERLAVPPGVTLIRSHHDHERTPDLEPLRALARELAEEGAIVKIATAVQRYGDLRTLDALARALPPPAVVLGLGERAHLLRLLSPLRNAFTYAFLPGGQPVAPGQIALDLYAATRHVRRPRIFGLLGGPSLRSRSPEIHNALFARHGVDAVYTLFPTDDLEEAWRALAAFDVHGFSVTTPHKQAALRYADRLDATAARLGSVNTLVREGTVWVGHQTDVDGITGGYPFLRGLRTTAIAGTGGVVPAVIDACRRLGIAEITVFGRDARRLAALSARFGVAARPLAELGGTPADAVVWTIPPDVEIALPRPRGPAHLIDLRYDRGAPLRRHAAALGYATHDGLPMLEHQARAQFRLFTGIAAAPSP